MFTRLQSRKRLVKKIAHFTSYYNYMECQIPHFVLHFKCMFSTWLLDSLPYVHDQKGRKKLYFHLCDIILVPSVSPRVTAMKRVNATAVILTWEPLLLVESRGFWTGYKVAYMSTQRRSCSQFSDETTITTLSVDIRRALRWQSAA